MPAVNHDSRNGPAASPDREAYLAALAERVKLFPVRLMRLADDEYVRTVAGFIAEDVGHLPDDWREDIFADLVALRVKAHRMREAAA